MGTDGFEYIDAQDTGKVQIEQDQSRGKRRVAADGVQQSDGLISGLSEVKFDGEIAALERFFGHEYVGGIVFNQQDLRRNIGSLRGRSELGGVIEVVRGR